MRALRIDRSEFETTLGSRLLDGVHLLGQPVTKEHEYLSYRARVSNWQTMNFIFLRAAFRDSLPSADYRALFLGPDARARRLSERVDTVKDALAHQIKNLRALGEAHAAARQRRNGANASAA